MDRIRADSTTGASEPQFNATQAAYYAGVIARSLTDEWARTARERHRSERHIEQRAHWSNNPMLMGLYCSVCFTVTGISTAVYHVQTTQMDICSSIPPILKPLLELPGVPNICWGITMDGRAQSAPSNNITRLRRAIIGQESGGNFKAVNPHSGALGYGQLMPYNVGPWTQEALGRSLTSQEFLNDREAQIQTIDHKLNQYWEEAAAIATTEDEIVRRVASKWYSGQSNLWNNTSAQNYNGHSYPSIANYTKSVLKKFDAEE